MRVDEIMAIPVTVTSQTPLGDIAGVLLEQGIGAVIVLDAEGEPTGIVSERDVTLFAGLETADPDEAAAMPAERVMRPLTVTVQANDDLEDAVEQMARLDVHNAPVLAEGVLVGVLSLQGMRGRYVDSEPEPILAF